MYKRQDEYLQSTGRGDPDGGAYQQLTLNLFLSEAEQIQSIDEAENVAHTSSAFSFAQNDIDHVLRLGGNTDRQRERVVAAFEKQKTTAEIAEILKTPVSYTHLIPVCITGSLTTIKSSKLY